jgi:hypothetical protein
MEAMEDFRYALMLEPTNKAASSLAFEDPWFVSASGNGKLAMMDDRTLLKLSSNVKFEKFTNCHSQNAIPLIRSILDVSFERLQTLQNEDDRRQEILQILCSWLKI